MTEPFIDIVGIATALAKKFHAGQTDKVGAPYFNHVRRVADRVADIGPGHEAVALLHDILEDTEATPADLLFAGLDTHIVDAVVTLTKIKGEPNVDYYKRVRTNTLAWNVKIADVADNIEPARLGALDAATRERLTEKYRKANAALGIK